MTDEERKEHFRIMGSKGGKKTATKGRDYFSTIGKKGGRYSKYDPKLKKKKRKKRTALATVPLVKNERFVIISPTSALDFLDSLLG